jgi:hypothetical protein
MYNKEIVCHSKQGFLCLLLTNYYMKKHLSPNINSAKFLCFQSDNKTNYYLNIHKYESQKQNDDLNLKFIHIL